MVRFTGWGGSTRAIAGLAAMLLVVGMGSAATAITLDSTEELTTPSVEPDGLTVEPTDESTSEPQADTAAPTDDVSSDSDTSSLERSVAPADVFEPKKSDLKEALEGEIVAPGEALRGERVEVSDLKPRTEVSFWIFSDPTDLGTEEVDDDGVATVTIPEDLELGSHTLAAYDEEEGQLGWTGLDVVEEKSPAAEEPTSDPEVPNTLDDEASTVPTEDPAGEPTDDSAGTTSAPQDATVDSLDGTSGGELGGASIMPLAAGGPESTVNGPYYYWTVPGAPATGGGSFTLQGPGSSSFWTSSVSWGDSLTVEDCVSSPCGGLDRDPDPGEYQVASGLGGMAPFSSTARFRLTPQSPPPGYTFASMSTVTQPGSCPALFQEGACTGDDWTGSGNSRSASFGSFAINQIPPMSPICEPGYVYSIQGSGQIVYSRPGTAAVTNLGSTAPNGAAFNGLGIGPAGSPVYAYSTSGTGDSAASSSRPRMYTYNTTSGTWTRSAHRPANDSNRLPGGFVAGGVDLLTGKYYMGGFASNGTQFRIWEYSGTGDPTYVGYINTSAGSGGSNNGDLAFNSSGDLFVVRGSGTQTTVFSVTAANLAAAGGSISTPIPSGVSTTVTTMSSVNGIAFDSSGKGYLGADYEIRSYDMPGWTNAAVVTGSLPDSYDLATCSSPPTITLEKYLDGNRVNSNNQFTLTLRQGTTILGTATTTGNNSGVQAERVGPLPTVPLAQLSFTETASGETNLNNYVTSWSCTADGEPITGASGAGRTGNVTIPTGVQDVNCRITNQPMVAKLTINKQVQGLNGELNVKEGWTVNATATATTGSITSRTPNATPLATNAQGNAEWTYGFNAATSRATITVSEEMQPFHSFVQGACLVERPGQNPREIILTGAGDQAITDIAPGDNVTCGYINKAEPFQCTSDTLINQASEDVGATGTASFNYLRAWSISGGGAWDDPFVDFTQAPYNITEQLNGLGVDATGYNFYFTSFGVGNSNAKVYWYNSQTGQLNSWAGAGMPAHGNNQVRRGAVDLSTGIYYYQTTNSAANADGTRTHHIYGFDPTQNGGAGWYAGSVRTPAGGTSGDMAFDFDGNMYMSADNVQGLGGSGNAVYVFNQPLPTFGDTISSSYPMGQLVTHIPSAGAGANRGNVVGLAYSAQGSLYLSTLNGYMAKIDPVTGSWTESTSAGAPPGVAASHTDDMATCVAPSTIKLEKDLPNGRHASADQFDLKIYRVDGNRQVGVTATTAGTEPDLQAAHVGPAPIVTGQDYTIVEETSGTTNFANYVSTYQCTDESANNWEGASGTLSAGTNGRLEATFTVPDPPAASSGRAIECVIKNELKPKLTLVKEVENPTVGSGYATETDWNLTATSSGTPITTITGATGAPAVTSQVVPVGAYTLREQWGTSTPDKSSGYDLTDLTCVNAAGSPIDDVDVDSASVTLAAGDDVTCTFTNTPKTGSVTWEKVDDQTQANLLGGSEWIITGSGFNENGTPFTDCTATECADLDKDPVAGSFLLEDLFWGEYTVTETKAPEGHQLANPAQSFTFTVDHTKVADTVTLEPVVNERIPGTVTWLKVDEGGDALANSEWEIVPVDEDGDAVGDPIPVTDCTSGDCDGLRDQNPAPGAFLIEDLDWGQYTLTETKAPAGYRLDDTEHEFTIAIGSLDYVFEIPFENEQITPPNLPLTGGIGRDFFFIAGGGVLLLGFGAVVVAQIRNRRREVA